MKKTILFTLVVITSCNLFAQSKKKSATSVHASSTIAKLNNQTDSLSIQAVW